VDFHAPSRVVTTIALTLVVLLTATPIWAQTGAQLATRRLLLEQAQAARAAGDHARALDLARHAAEIRMSPSVRMFVAEEEAATGQLAAALGDADQCAIDAQHDQASQTHEEIFTACRQLEASLRSRVGQIVVNVSEPAIPGLQVTVAGDPLGSSLFGTPSVVTAGDVVVEAHAPGYAPVRQTVHVAAEATAATNVVLVRQVANASPPPTPEPASSSAAPPVTAAATNATVTPRPTPAPRTVWLTPLRIAGIVGAVVGAGSLAAGAILYFDVDHQFNACVPHLCTAANEPRGEDVAAFAAFWGGAVVFAVGAVVVLASPSRRESPPAVSVWLDPRGSAAIVGRF
jgi:hypothetical protein